MDRKLISLLSLAQKSGKLCAGEYSCEKALQNGNAKLIIIASDASDNTKKKFENKAFFYNVKVLVLADRQSLSQAIGKENRVTLAITDKGFADRLLEQSETEVG